MGRRKMQVRGGNCIEVPLLWGAKEENRTASLLILDCECQGYKPFSLRAVATNEISDTFVRDREISVVWQRYEQGLYSVKRESFITGKIVGSKYICFKGIRKS